jgi:hypothetical protein
MKARKLEIGTSHEVVLLGSFVESEGKDSNHSIVGWLLRHPEKVDDSLNF